MQCFRLQRYLIYLELLGLIDMQYTEYPLSDMIVHLVLLRENAQKDHLNRNTHHASSFKRFHTAFGDASPNPASNSIV